MLSKPARVDCYRYMCFRPNVIACQMLNVGLHHIKIRYVHYACNFDMNG